jgi:hypothetical protein
MGMVIFLGMTAANTARAAIGMTKAQYIAQLTAIPWRFPEAEGIADAPPDWAVAAWEMEAVREPIVAELVQGVSKFGELCLDEKQLTKMSEVLRTDQVIAIYMALIHSSPHRESEFRAAFARLFAKHASHLPKELTRDEIVQLLGVDEATAATLLGEE